MFQKYMKKLFSIKLVHSLNCTFLIGLLVFAKITKRKILCKKCAKKKICKKETLDKGKSVGAIFMNLSKAFDILNHTLLIAKLEAYGFFKNSPLNYSQSYLVNRLQKANVKLSKDVFAQEPILGPEH